ncbi:MAG: hypothetical protein JNL95_03985 [Chitinophagales bacterium]|nr:hypothetical protein [Chitinophagales bacterium]
MKTIHGKVFRFVTYKSPDREDEHDNKIIYKRDYSIMSFEKFRGDVVSDTSKKMACYQFDSTRIYIKKCDSDIYNYSCLFTSGLIYPNIIAYALNTSNIIPKDSIQIFRHGSISFQEFILDTTFKKENYNWFVSKIYFTRIKELPYLEKNTTRMFELEQTIFSYNRLRCFCYLVELTNEKADKKTLIHDFIKDARLTFIKNSTIEIE